MEQFPVFKCKRSELHQISQPGGVVPEFEPCSDVPDDPNDHGLYVGGAILKAMYDLVTASV